MDGWGETAAENEVKRELERQVNSVNDLCNSRSSWERGVVCVTPKYEKLALTTMSQCFCYTPIIAATTGVSLSKLKYLKVNFFEDFKVIPRPEFNPCQDKWFVVNCYLKCLVIERRTLL